MSIYLVTDENGNCHVVEFKVEKAVVKFGGIRNIEAAAFFAVYKRFPKTLSDITENVQRVLSHQIVTNDIADFMLGNPEKFKIPLDDEAV
jgi:hypothetical protein